MKIIKKYIKTDNKKLKNQIENKFGVNIEKYKNPEIVTKIGNMILFPKYAYKNILGPVILALLCFIGSFFVFNLSTISIVIYSIIGLGFWVIFGVFSGINYFLYRVKNDLMILLVLVLI